jgi:hypothetical protein
MIPDVNAENLKSLNQHIATLEKKDIGYCTQRICTSRESFSKI